MKHHIGIDCGSVSINSIVIDEKGEILFESPYVRHFGHAREETRRLLADLADRFGNEHIASLSFTGIHGQGLAEELGVPYEVETIAQVEGAVHLSPGVKTIICVGGQDAALFQLVPRNGQWSLDSFAINGPCASGTGSFIDQQAERLASSMYGKDLNPDQHKVQSTLEDFIELGMTSDHPAPVACRCTVFTKSDMIHLQNKGEPLANIIAGLHSGNAANYVSTIVGNRSLESPMLFVGGMASNPLQMKAFQHYYPELTVPPYHTSLGALGVALQARRQGTDEGIDLVQLAKAEYGSSGSSLKRGERLELQLTEFDPDNSLEPRQFADGEVVPAYLGVDIGSTTTKYALIDEEGRIFHKSYVQTSGKPIDVARKLLRSMHDDLGNRITLTGIATTGSGRQVVGDFLRADLILDEITAHARGAVEVNPDIDTIFEIGGQDSKYIRLENGQPIDFDMNKVCAAGTGSFLHELANKMGINIVDEFQDTALSSTNPVSLAERCTVFMESDLVSYLQKGAPRDDLIAGLSYAIVHNYLNRVVGKRTIGKLIMFLGGPSLNKAIVAAFEKILQRPLAVPKHREVMGAFGAALSIREAIARGDIEKSAHDLQSLAGRSVDFKEKVCRVDRVCHNECKLKVYDFGGRKSIWGGDCGRYEVGRRGASRKTNYFKERDRLFHEALEGSATVLDSRSGDGGPAREAGSIGIPLALHSLEWGIFWARTLSELGYSVFLSPPTDNRIAQAGIESMTAETCFPVKVFQGHVSRLQEQVESIFLPNVINMPTPAPEEKGMFCPYIESSQYMVKAALSTPEERILRPTLFLKDGPEGIAESFRRSLPSPMRPSRRGMEDILRKAWQSRLDFIHEIRSQGEEILKGVSVDEPLWIITGRPYNLYDERCNLQLGRHLSALGITSLPMDYLDLEREDLSDFSNMFWGLGSRILRAARRVSRSVNLYAVHITNFGCGADSFLEHFYRHLMHERPFLTLELDEHSAVAGMLTRLEAFQNVVNNSHRVKRRIIPKQTTPPKQPMLHKSATVHQTTGTASRATG